MDFARRHSQFINTGIRKTQSANLYDHKPFDRSYKRNKDENCFTPSTEDNHSLSTAYGRSKQQAMENNMIKYNKMSKTQYDLFHLIYMENYTFNDLQDYFQYSFFVIRNLSFFHQTLYTSIKKYLQRLLGSLHQTLNDVSDYRAVQLAQDRQPDSDFQKKLFKNFGQHATKYCNLLSSLVKSYDLIDEKSQEIQLVVNYYLKYVSSLNEESISQQVNCSELHRTLFIEQILKDDEIKCFLDNISAFLQEHKFYQKSFRNAYVKLEKLNILRTQKHKPAIQQTSNTAQKKTSVTKPKQTNTDFKEASSSFEQSTFKPLRLDLNVSNQTHDPSDLFVSPKEASTQSSTILLNTESNGKKLKKKRKNKNKQNENIPIECKGKTFSKVTLDDVKEFERKIDLEYELTKQNEKIPIEFPQDWINKLKHRLIHTLKTMH